MLFQDIIKKRILVFGSNGMLGQRVIEIYRKHPDVELMTSSSEENSIFPDIPYAQCDITHREAVKKVVYDFVPDVIINASAYTNVDKCESERELAWKVNVKGVEYICEACRVLDTHLIHISTDYVFDGTKGPYSEIDTPLPVSYYGRTKLASENAIKISGAMHTIIRTNVLYGVISSGRLDFVRWVVNSIRGGQKIRIVTDQINNPTFLDDLAGAIAEIIRFKKYGLYNIGGRELLSRYDFTLKIVDYFNLDPTFVTAILTSELNQPAKRPLKSGLIILKAESEFNYKPVTIDESLGIMKKELNL